MSYIPNFSTFPFITTGDNARYDDNQYFDDLATITALTPKYTDVKYIAKDTWNEYRWDGTNLVLMASGVGSLVSIIGGNQVNVDNTDPVNPIINA